MEKKLCTLDICGLDVRVYLTDDQSILKPSKQEAEELNIDEDKESFGRYLVDECKIWLNSGVSAEALKPQLFHEVYEFTLGYFAVRYDAGNEHEAFVQFAYVLWGVFRRNRKMLFGKGIEKALKRID